MQGGKGGTIECPANQEEADVAASVNRVPGDGDDLRSSVIVCLVTNKQSH